MRGAARLRSLALVLACAWVALGGGEAGAFALRSSVIGNGATPSGGMGNGTRAMQATVGQAVVGLSGDGTKTLVHGFWARGGVLLVGVEEGPPAGPSAIAFGMPRPNPSHAGVNFTVAIPERGDVRLDVFDLQGRAVEQILNAELPAGLHSVRWNARVSAGVYLARLVVGGRVVAERRVVMVR